MSGIVEAMARAMCEASGDQWSTGTYSLSTGPNFEWEDHSADPLNNHWRHKALAALKAMREPSGQMIRAACPMVDDEAPVPFVKNMWRAMVEAAIQEHSSTVNQGIDK